MEHNYGTISESQGHISTNGNASEAESQVLLPKDNRSSSQRFRFYMRQDINTKYGDLVLLLCYVITGLLDSSAVYIWGAFVSMQTGNTVYFGLGIANPNSNDRWIKSLISISFFCLGSFIFARFHRYFSPRARWVLAISFAAQLVAIVAAAVIVSIDSKSEDDLRWEVVVPLAIVAFQSSGQAVTSRALKYNALTSVVLTSIYCDLFSDAELFVGPSKNVERNRRAAAPLCLLFGAILGGYWSNSNIGLAGALWTAVGLKLLIVVAWMLWKKAQEDG